MGREVGGGIGMGKTCEPKAFSFQCKTKFTTNKKKKKKERKKESLKKKRTYCTSIKDADFVLCATAPTK